MGSTRHFKGRVLHPWGSSQHSSGLANGSWNPLILCHWISPWLPFPSTGGLSLADSWVIVITHTKPAQAQHPGLAGSLKILYLALLSRGETSQEKNPWQLPTEIWGRLQTPLLTLFTPAVCIYWWQRGMLVQTAEASGFRAHAFHLLNQDHFSFLGGRGGGIFQQLWVNSFQTQEFSSVTSSVLALWRMLHKETEHWLFVVSAV